MISEEKKKSRIPLAVIQKTRVPEKSSRSGDEIFMKSKYIVKPYKNLYRTFPLS
jgi:hypothetical protein